MTLSASEANYNCRARALASTATAALRTLDGSLPTAFAV